MNRKMVKVQSVDGSSPFVGVQEAAALVRISPVTLRRLLTQKRLTRHKLGSRTLLLRAEVMALVTKA